MSMNQGRPAGRRFPIGGPMGGGPVGPGMHGEKAKDFKGTIRKLLAYIRAHLYKMIFVWMLAAIATVLSIFGPKILGQATDIMVEGLTGALTGGPGIDFGAIGFTLLTVASLYAASALMSFFQGFVMSRVTTQISYQMRKDINEKINRLPIRFFDNTTHGEVLSRITNDVDTVSMSLSQSLTQIISSLTMLIGILILMLTISWRLTLVALTVIPLTMVFVSLIIKLSQKHFKRQQEFLGHVNGHIEEMYGSHSVVKAFNGEAASLEKFNKYNNTLYNSAWKSGFLSSLMMPVTMFVGNLGYVAICLLGGYFTANGTMTLGGIQGFITYMRQFTQPLSQLAQISNVLQQLAAAAERVFNLLAEPEESPDAADALMVRHTEEMSLSVTFENVRYGYDPEKPVIQNFSADVKPGSTVAIVGPTGAGKTTIVKLLMRFYDLQGGRITVGGADLTQYRRNDVRSLFGMVLQDTWLFHGTIGDNIRYGRLDATRAQIEAAASAAQIHHFIRSLPGGYGLMIDEDGGNISQGQKQLLTIARAILADPKILILDEATSSVDTRTEVLIQRAMLNLMKGRTCFVIAHRLSTIRGADLILVMKDGDIAEQGTHAELLARNGVYADLYNSQFENAG